MPHDKYDHMYSKHVLIKNRFDNLILSFVFFMLLSYIVFAFWGGFISFPLLLSHVKYLGC